MFRQSAYDPIPTERKHDILLAHMQYPRTKKLDANDSPVETCTYSCEEGEPCDFAVCLETVRDSVELRAFGCQTNLLEIVEDIAKHQDDYMARRLDGYQLYRCGIDLIRIRRTENGEECKLKRTGTIEYNDIRTDEIKRKQEFRMGRALHRTHRM